MERIKDFFYDKNDIFIAFVIFIVAAVIILFRVQAIVSYPSYAAAQAAAESAAVSELTGDQGGETLPVEGTEPGVATDPAITDDVELYAIYINPGESVTTIAQKFVDVGLFESTEQFINLAEELGISTQIKTGNFIMPADSTPEEVMSYIIKPGL